MFTLLTFITDTLLTSPSVSASCTHPQAPADARAGYTAALQEVKAQRSAAAAEAAGGGQQQAAAGASALPPGVKVRLCLWLDCF